MAEEAETPEEKPSIGLIVIGHENAGTRVFCFVFQHQWPNVLRVSTGKSTTAGHFLYQLGKVDEQLMEQNAQESEECGQRSYKFAWIVDKKTEERERKSTIDISTAHFETQHYRYTIVDAPGHRDFVKNMITGVSAADVGILLVDARPTVFETQIGKDGQTREHALLAYTLGVKQLIVGINHMDQIEYSEEQYIHVKSVLSEYLRKVGYKPMKIAMIPISGFEGDNLTKLSKENLPWYTGPTLLESLDAVLPPRRQSALPLRMSIQDVHEIKKYTVLVGRIETGRMEVGMKVQIAPMPDTCCGVIKSLEIHKQPVQCAQAGDVVGCSVESLPAKDIKRGFVVSNADNRPATAIKCFEAQIIVMNHPGQITTGYCPMVDVHTAHVPCRFTLKTKMDRRSGQVQEEHPEFVEMGDACLVDLEPIKDVCVESFAEFPALGRFAVRDAGAVVAVGVIKSVTPVHEPEPKGEIIEL